MPPSSFSTAVDIVNLAHSLKDICEVDCKSPDCMNTVLKALLQYNLIQLNLMFSEQLCCAACPDTGEHPAPDNRRNTPGRRDS